MKLPLRGGVTVKELGKTLKEAREEKGLTYEEVFEKTKIQPRYLKALEEGNLDVFPGEVYARGSLRNYARILGLDEKMVLNEYYQHRGHYSEALSREKKSREKPLYTKDDSIWKNLVIGILAIVLLFAGIQGYQYYFGTNNDKAVDLPEEGRERDIPSPYEPDDWEEEEREDNEEEEEEEVRETELVLADNDSLGRVYHLIYSEKIELEVNFSERCWARFTLDDGEAIDSEYGDGDIIKEDAEKEIWLRLGNPRGAKVRINGIDVDLEGISSPMNITVKLMDEVPDNLDDYSGSNE
ncbi:MAG: helix-turn-helix domain-containing protein [Candidatus Syntrophonatronum acetioxidans]|uniref:Helix-turn-helix domain-containing protein n=1 Tax=Candidatus Syntrophonatronum acetioxidans TaxID=1795816 RepID=A0A424YDG2_9FIRM|nr:MAG: helix-turn-helix domain-containing protein [Candidatus Syntrophonatronum acetioxidans]